MTIESLKKANEISSRLSGIERDAIAVDYIFAGKGGAFYRSSSSEYLYFSGLSSETLAAVKALVEVDLQRQANALKKELEAL